MNRDDIIRMALEAGFTLCRRHEWVPRNEFAMVDENVDGDLACLIQFAEFVAAAEREACAEVCEERIGGAVQTNEWWSGFRAAMKSCAAAIRARGEK